MLGDLLDHRFRSSRFESGIAHPAGLTRHLFHCAEPHTEPEFLNFSGAQESIPRNQFRQACVAGRAGTTTLFLLGS